MPYVVLPTGSKYTSDGEIEGGLIVPLAIEVPFDFDLGFTFAFSARRGADDKLAAGGEASCSIGYTLFDRLRFYVEVWGAASTEVHTRPLATLDVGFSLKVTPDIQLDGGVNLGLTPASDDVNPFVGISVRY
jgi:hypothetical protein